MILTKLKVGERRPPDLSRDYGSLSAPPKLSHFPMRIWILKEIHESRKWVADAIESHTKKISPLVSDFGSHVTLA